MNAKRTQDTHPPCTKPSSRWTNTRRAGAFLSIGVVAAAGSALFAPTSTPAVPMAASAPDDSTAAILEQAGVLSVERTAAVAKTSRSAARSELPSEDDAAAQAAAEKKAAAKKAAAEEKAAAAKQAAEEAAKKAAEAGDVIGTRYATVPLNARTEPDADAKVSTVLDPGDKVKITDVSDSGWRQILVNDKPRWVKASYLSKSKPEAEAAAPKGLSTAPCASGSGVEGPLQAHAIAVHRAVCARYPQIKTYGGYRAGSEYHSAGRALDIMVSDSALRAEIADWLRANASELGIMEIIRSQHIWTVQRSGEGWRMMPDRGSITDNHYDHVHVSLY